MQEGNGGSVKYRSKRVQYAARACKECKRRKVKCDGKQPCARCYGQGFSCEYLLRQQNKQRIEPFIKPQDDMQNEGREAGISDLASPVGSAQLSVPTILADTASDTFDRTNMSHEHRALPEYSTNSLEFSGPSSIEYTFNAVNGNLRALGIQSAIPDKNKGWSAPSSSTGKLMQYGPFFKLLTMDPLWDMARDDAITLIDDWILGLGSVYPIVSRRTLIEAAGKVFRALDKARSEGLRERGGSVAEALFNHNTNKLKIVLAIGIVKRAGGRQHQAERLFQSTAEAVEGLIWDPDGIHGIQLLMLVGTYHYHLDEEVRTGRCIAFAARLCLEAGLHRRATVDELSQSSSERFEALQAFWAVYMFERRLSLGQGIPFSIQDAYIDASLYTIDLANPLLPSLLQWTKMAGKTWHLLNNQMDTTYESKVEDITYLDYQILEWFDALPEEFQLTEPSAWSQENQPTYLQSVIFVRKANLRCLIYRPLLQFPTQSRQHELNIQRAIKIAGDTARTLRSLNDFNSLLFNHPMFFQPLLLTAFGTLLLAVINVGPETRNSVREEFDMYLHIFQSMSSRCTALRRTWRRLQGLRDLHAKLSHSDRRAQTSSLDSETPEGGSVSGGTLSFDDIFPDSRTFSSLIGTVDPFPEIRSEPQTSSSQNNNNPIEDFLGFENLFDFPFPNLTGFA